MSEPGSAWPQWPSWDPHPQGSPERTPAAAEPLACVFCPEHIASCVHPASVMRILLSLRELVRASDLGLGEESGECSSPTGDQDGEPHCWSQPLVAPCQGQDEVEVSPPHILSLGPVRAGAWESSSPCPASAEAWGSTDQSDVYPLGDGVCVGCCPVLSPSQGSPGCWAATNWLSPVWSPSPPCSSPWGFSASLRQPSMGQGPGSQGQTKVAVVGPTVLGRLEPELGQRLYLNFASCFSFFCFFFFKFRPKNSRVIFSPHPSRDPPAENSPSSGTRMVKGVFCK